MNRRHFRILKRHPSFQRRKVRDPLRNKAKGFPYEHDNKFNGEPRAKPEYASKRADGTTNTRPQERMHASGERDSE
jgi:small acid-soluble spore protein K (minor)